MAETQAESLRSPQCNCLKGPGGGARHLQSSTVAFGEEPASIHIGDLVIENRRTLTFVDRPED